MYSFAMGVGSVISGGVAEEVRIRTATGAEVVLPVSAIEERHKLPTSTMPTGLLATFTTRECASLLDYLESLPASQ